MVLLVCYLLPLLPNNITMGKRKLSIKKRHHSGIRIKPQEITKIETVWQVKSGRSVDTHYLVKNTPDLCREGIFCGSWCKLCKVCRHKFSCTCSDYSERMKLCRHIHAVRKTCFLLEDETESTDSSDDGNYFQPFFGRRNKCEIRHERGRYFKPQDILRVQENLWHVISASDPSSYYTIQQYDCDELHCRSTCRKCKACLHQYTCTCPDNSENSNLCKHIHAVGIKCYEEMKEVTDTTDTFSDTDEDEYSYKRHREYFKPLNKCELRHQRGMQIVLSDIMEITDYQWQVKSQTDNNFHYVVRKYSGICHRSSCHISINTRCQKCNVCKHIFVCECPDYDNSNLCKHIHAVANKIKSSASKYEFSSESKNAGGGSEIVGIMPPTKTGHEEIKEEEISTADLMNNEERAVPKQEENMHSPKTELHPKSCKKIKKEEISTVDLINYEDTVIPKEEYNKPSKNMSCVEIKKEEIPTASLMNYESLAIPGCSKLNSANSNKRYSIECIKMKRALEDKETSKRIFKKGNYSSSKE